VRKRQDWLWYVPASALLLVVVLYPILHTLLLSFFRENLTTGFALQAEGLGNFRRLLADSRFRNSVGITLLFSAVSVAAEFGLGLLLALSAQRMNQWRNAVRAVLLIPWTMPTAVTAVLWAWIFNDQYGVLNTLLMRIRLIAQPVAWLAQPSSAMFAIIAADVWKTVPFVFLILLAGLQSVPQDLYEAIEIDGGRPWSAFRYVTWPHLRPFVFVALVFRFVQAFAVFDLVWAMTGGGPGGATETVSVYTYRTYMRYLDFGYGSALIVATVVILAVFAAVLYQILLRNYEHT